MRTNEPENVKPEGSFPYMWKAKYFEDPTQLWFEGPEKDTFLDFDNHFYFTLEEENKQKTLLDFVLPIMSKIKMEIN